MSAAMPPPADANGRHDDRTLLTTPALAPELPALNHLLTLAICVLVVTALDLAREVLIPITLSVLLSFVLAPLASLLRKLRIGRVFSVLLAVFLALAVILAIGGLIGTQVASLVGEVPQYQSTIEKKVKTIRAMTIGRLEDVLNSVGKQFTPPPSTPAAAPAQPPDARLGNGSSSERAVPVIVHQPDPSPFDLAERVISPVVGPLSTVAVVFIVAIFILLQREDLRDRLIRLFGSGDLHRTTVAMNDAAARLSRYFLAQVAVNASFGVVITLGLLAIGVPSPVLWGVLAALLRFLPYIGAWIAAAMPIALAAAVDPGWSTALWTGGLFVAVEGITGQVIEPMLYSHSTGLSPVSVVVAATFWTWLWGPIGLIMSTPLSLCLVVLGRHVKKLEFLEVLLGDRPALTPVESFYQRMLAGDAEEAYDQAAALLQQRSLSSYYDEVAIPGLRMAADDRLRGVLTERQVLRIQHAVDAVLRDLADHEDADPEMKPDPEDAIANSRAEEELPMTPAPTIQAPPQDRLPPVWRGDAAVLCVAGRGPLDGAAAAMLAQLLNKHGLGARVLDHEDVAPRRFAALDLSQTAMACVCYLRTSGTPSHVRYLIRRLRQKRPDMPIMVGLWPAGEEVLDNARHQATLGATHYVGTLHDSVETCVGAAVAAALPEDANETPPAAALEASPAS